MTARSHQRLDPIVGSEWRLVISFCFVFLASNSCLENSSSDSGGKLLGQPGRMLAAVGATQAKSGLGNWVGRPLEVPSPELDIMH